MKGKKKLYAVFDRSRWRLSKRNPTHAFFKAGKVLWVSKICRTDISHFLFCLPVCLSPWRSSVLLSHFSINFHCLSASASLSPVSVSLDEAVRVTLNTKCPSVPRMWTTQCSLILKLVNIDQWRLPLTHTQNSTTIHTYTHTRACRHRSLPSARSIYRQLRGQEMTQ